MAVSELASSLDDDVLTAISTDFGGLANFLRQDPSRFILEKQGGKLAVSFAATMSSPDDDDVVEYCDVFRLARLLSCENFTALTAIPDGVVQRPIMDVVRLQPERFEVRRDDLSSSLIGEIVLCDPWSLDSEGSYSIRYKIPPNVQTVLAARNNLDELTLEQLEQESKKVKDLRPVKRIKARRKIIRAIIRKRFPLGNPLMDPPVTALLLFDVLPETPVANSGIAELLPNKGRDGCPFDRAFFLRFPNLFAVVEDLHCMNSFTIVRRDCAGPASTRGCDVSLTDDEAVAELMSRLMTLPRASYTKSFLVSCASRAACQKLSQIGLDSVIKKYPDVFSVTLQSPAVSAEEKEAAGGESLCEDPLVTFNKDTAQEALERIGSRITKSMSSTNSE